MHILVFVLCPVGALLHVNVLPADNPRYVEANAGCKHFDVHGGPENIPVSRFSFDSKVTHSCEVI